MEEPVHGGTKLKPGSGARILAMVIGRVDRIIPEDEEVPLGGVTVAEFLGQLATIPHGFNLSAFVSLCLHAPYLVALDREI